MPLRTVLHNVNSSNKHDVLVIFDLDSTIFDVSPRTEEILKRFSKDNEVSTKFPNECKILENVEVLSSDWGIFEPIRRLKISSTIDFFHIIQDYWRTHFFSNDFLHFDKPYEGSIEYILELHNSGAKISYLTGRDQHRMGEGTKKILIDWGLPLDEEHILYLKPQKGMSDSKFKLDIIKDLTSDYKEVWLFENEPVNTDLIEKELPEVQIVFVDSVHSGRSVTPEHLPQIKTKFHW